MSRRPAIAASLDSARREPSGREWILPSTTAAAQSVYPAAGASPIRKVKSLTDGQAIPAHELAEMEFKPRRSVLASAPSVPSVQQQGQQAPTPPQRIYSPLPHWPAEARQARRGGRVVVRATVGNDGFVKAVSVYRSSGVDSLDRSAVLAVRRWRFQPARRFGLAVEMDVGVPINFHVGLGITR